MLWVVVCIDTQKTSRKWTLKEARCRSPLKDYCRFTELTSDTRTRAGGLCTASLTLTSHSKTANTLGKRSANWAKWTPSWECGSPPQLHARAFVSSLTSFFFFESHRDNLERQEEEEKKKNRQYLTRKTIKSRRDALWRRAAHRFNVDTRDERFSTHPHAPPINIPDPTQRPDRDKKQDKAGICCPRWTKSYFKRTKY